MRISLHHDGREEWLDQIRQGIRFLVGPVTLAFADDDSLEINSQELQIFEGLFESIKKTGRHISLELCGVHRQQNAAQEIVEAALRILPTAQMEKIVLSDPSWITLLHERQIVPKKLVCIAYLHEEWSAHLDGLCAYLRGNSNNENNSRLESFQIRAWSYGAADFRSIQTLSWDQGLDQILLSLAGQDSLTSLQLDVLSLSKKKIEALHQLLSNLGCRIEDLGLKCCPAAHQRYKLDSILPVIESCGNIKSLRLCGWDLSMDIATTLLGTIGKWAHFEKLDLDRSRLSFSPDNTHFFMALLDMGKLKYLRTHIGGTGRRYEQRHCLDLDLLLPSLQNASLLECLTLDCMNVSMAQANTLLRAIASLPNLHYVKLINLPQITTVSRGQASTQDFLDILTEPTSIRRLILTGVGAPFVGSNSRDDAYREKSRWWIESMMKIHRQLFSFGPAVNRLVRDDPLLQALADDNHFRGLLLVEDQKYHPHFLSLLPLILARAIESLQDEPERLAGVLWRSLVSNISSILFPGNTTTSLLELFHVNTMN